MNPRQLPRIGPGPVFAYESLIGSRRWQTFAARAGFVLFVLVAIGVVYISENPAGILSIRGLAAIGEQFYKAAIGTQLTLILMVAPAATAGAICLDRSRGTLAHLMVTDLSDAEIVLGKLAARLVPVFGLIGCTLPLMALMSLLGGVDSYALLGGFLVSVGTAALGCSLALAFSLWVGKTHEALMATYAVWGLWLLSTPMVQTLNRSAGLSVPILPIAVQPFELAFAPYTAPSLIRWTHYLTFLAVTLALSAALASLAVVRLRPVALREPVPRSRKRLAGFRARLEKVEGVLRPLFSPVGPPLDFNPVLWREWHRNRSSRWARLVAILFAVLSSVFSVFAVLSDPSTSAWVNGLQVSIGLLLLSVISATSLAEERARGSLDILMSTTLTTPEIVLGKWLGTFRVAVPLVVLPTLVMAGGLTWRFWLWPTLGLMPLYIFTAGAAVTSLGLAMATWFSRLGRAVALTIAAYVVAAVGWLLLLMVLGQGGPDREGWMMGSPFFWAGELTWEFVSDSRLEHLRAAAFWIWIYACGAGALLIATLLTFNRCLGRVDSLWPELSHVATRRIAPARKEVMAGTPSDVV